MSARAKVRRERLRTQWMVESVQSGGWLTITDNLSRYSARLDPGLEWVQQPLGQRVRRHRDGDGNLWVIPLDRSAIRTSGLARRSMWEAARWALLRRLPVIAGVALSWPYLGEPARWSLVLLSASLLACPVQSREA